MCNVCGSTRMPMHVETRGRLCKFDLLPSFCGFWELNSGHQVCKASILPHEPFHRSHTQSKFQHWILLKAGKSPGRKTTHIDKNQSHKMTLRRSVPTSSTEITPASRVTWVNGRSCCTQLLDSGEAKEVTQIGLACHFCQLQCTVAFRKKKKKTKDLYACSIWWR